MLLLHQPGETACDFGAYRNSVHASEGCHHSSKGFKPQRSAYARRQLYSPMTSKQGLSLHDVVDDTVLGMFVNSLDVHHAHAKRDVGIQSRHMLMVLIQKLLSSLTMGIDCMSEHAGYQPSHEPMWLRWQAASQGECMLPHACQHKLPRHGASMIVCSSA